MPLQSHGSAETNDTIVATYVKQGGKKFALTPSGLIYYDDLSITADKK